MTPSVRRTDPLLAPSDAQRPATRRAEPGPRPARSGPHHAQQPALIGAGIAAALLALGGIMVAVFGGGSAGVGPTVVAIDELSANDAGGAGETASDATGGGASEGAGAGTPVVDTVAEAEVASPDAGTVSGTEPPDLVEAGFEAGEECIIEPRSMRIGSTGSSVQCLQQALTEAGYYSGPVNGDYQASTAAAVEALQIDRNLYVDGVAGRETGISLDIWPDEQMFVVRTPIPPPGATDDLGYPLSSVAVAGADAPPLPANSGSGYRVVYERISQRVWAVNADDEVVRSWLVAGSQYSNEIPGVHQVYSRSEMSTAWNGAAYLPKMIRWLKTERGAIGFHAIPYGVNDGEPYMTEAEMGQRLSGGCQRQSNLDADFLWDFAPVGTTVVVL